MFLHCAFWVVHDVRLGVRKNAIFSARKNAIFSARKNVIFSDAEKMTFFRVRQYGAFWLQRSHCGDGYHISPPTGLNLESAEISTSKLANSKQQMSKSIQEFLKCTLISSPLVRWKWPTQVRTLGTLWWGWNLGPWNDAIHDFRRSVQNVFSGIWKNAVFSGHGSRMTVRKNPGYLAGWLSGWLAAYLCAGWLAIWQLALWLAIWLLAIWLAGWLADWHWLWLSLWMDRSLACYLAI